MVYLIIKKMIDYLSQICGCKALYSKGIHKNIHEAEIKHKNSAVKWFRITYAKYSKRIKAKCRCVVLR